MGKTELRKALQNEGEEQIRSYWRQVEESISAKRKEIETKRARLQEENDRRLQVEGSLLSGGLLLDAQTKALKGTLHAESELEERMLALAGKMLPGLVNENRSSLWDALRAELPAEEWTALKIHPDDQESAARDFPSAAIECDASLGGGLIVTNADSAIRVDNSLACRLMRAWPDLMPKLLGELLELVNDDETAHPDTTD